MLSMILVTVLIVLRCWKDLEELSVLYVLSVTALVISRFIRVCLGSLNDRHYLLFYKSLV